jgi:phosphatidylglycerophosphatase A
VNGRESADAALSPVRLTWRFVFHDPAHCIALGAGAGLAPRAPGTVGTLLAWAIYVFAAPAGGRWPALALIGAAFALGIWACARTARALGKGDPGAIVWDEMVAFWLVLALAPQSLVWQAIAFVLFRVFDIWKPQPIRYCDRAVKGGFGIMLDDLLAALYSLLILALAGRFTGA